MLLSELQSAVEPRKALFSRCRHTHCSVHVSGGDDDGGGGGDDDDGEDGDGDVGEDGGDGAATSVVLCACWWLFSSKQRNDKFKL